MNKFLEIINLFLIFLRLGCTSFGGPIAHLSYFREEFVERRRWLNEHAYVDLVALCQLLPGPASSQVGIAIGLARANYIGAIVAWLGFTLPSAIVLILLFAYGLAEMGNAVNAGWIHGLKVVAVAVVAQAVWSMDKSLCPDPTRITFAVIAALMASLFAILGSGRFTQIGIPYPDIMASFVGVTEVTCGLFILFGLATRLAAIPLIIIMIVAIISTKIPILLGHDWWLFHVAKFSRYGFWSMMHEIRADSSRLLASLYLLIRGAGQWSIDAWICGLWDSRYHNS